MPHTMEYDTKSPCINTSCGKLFVHLCFGKKSKNLELVLVNYGKAGVCANTHLTAYTYLVTSLLQNKAIARVNIMEALLASTGHNCNGQFGMSCTDQLARLVVDTLQEEQQRVKK